MSDNAPPQPIEETPRRPQSGPGHPYTKTPILAGMLSLAPGLGNIYNGLYLRGVSFFLLWIGLFATAVNVEEDGDLALLIPSLVFTWLFNIFDAYRQATLINYGYPVNTAETLTPRKVGAGGGLMLGVAVFAVGLYGLVRELFPHLQLTWILNYWYLGFMAFGGWLVYQAMQQKKEADVSSIDDPLAAGGSFSSETE